MAIKRVGLCCVVVALAACGGDDVFPQDAPPPDGRPPLPDVVTVPLKSLEQASLYVAPWIVDTQTFDVQIDTGSSITAVAAMACGAKCKGTTPLWAPGSGAVDTKLKGDTEYADSSSWSGEIFTDVSGVTPASQVPLNFVAITAQNQFFYSDNSYQGILGLGPSDLLEPGTDTYPDQLGSAGLPEIMAFQECPDRGQMWLGGFDASAGASAPVYTPMVALDPQRQPFYAVNVASMTMGSASLGSNANAFGDTLVDTGTSISFFPTPVAVALIAAVNASPGFQALFPGQAFANTDAGGCVSSQTVTTEQVDAMFPALTVSFPATDGGTPTAMDLSPSRSYIAVDGMGGFCLSFYDSGGGARDGSLIGDSMQAAFLTVFDVPNKRIGFAPEAGCSTAVAHDEHAVRRSRVAGPWWASLPHTHGPRVGKGARRAK